MNGIVRRTGSPLRIQCQKTSASNCTPMIWTVWNSTSRTRWNVCRPLAPLALAATSMARSLMRPMVCRWLVLCPAYQTHSRRIHLPSVSPKAAARVRSWRNGSCTAKLNWTCGRSIHVVTQITPITTTACPRRWKLMATNTPCTSHTTNGRQGATKSYRQTTPSCWHRAHRWGPTTVGNVPTGSPTMAMTHPRPQPKHGRAKGRGSNGLRRKSRPAQTQQVSSICRASRGTRFLARVLPNGYVVKSQGPCQKRAA